LRMTNSGGKELDQNLVGPRIRKLDFVHD